MKGKHEIIRVNFEGVWMLVRDFGEAGEPIECECGNEVRSHLWEVPTGLFSKDYFLACPQCSRYAMIPKRAAEELNRGARLEVLSAMRETPVELKRVYREWKKKPQWYEAARNSAVRLTWLCSKYNPSLSAEQLVHERLEDNRLDKDHAHFWRFVSLILLFESNEVSRSAVTGEGSPLRALWHPSVPPPPGWSPAQWTAFQQRVKETHEPLAVALGCDVDDL